MAGAGVAVTAVHQQPCPWSLPDAAAAARFCRLLFGLEGVVGLEHHSNGAVTILPEPTYEDLVRF